MSLRSPARTNAPRLSIGLALALSAIGLLTVISLRLDGDLQRRSDLLTHTAVVEGNLARMESELLAAETGQRGFLLTGDSSYLDSYHAALPSIPRELAALQDLLAQSPAQQQRLLTVQQLVQAKMTELHESIGLRGQRGESAATAVMTHGRGRRLMEALRGELSDMRVAEGAQLQERLLLRKGAAVASRNSLILESGILALALLLTVLVYRSQVTQARAEAELDRVISELRAAEAELRSHARSLEQNVAERTRLLETRASELARSNEELERFAYVASHDLQEPLRMVTNFTQLLQHRYRGKLGTDADDFIEYAVTGVERMHALIKDLLTYSRARTRPLEPETVDLRSVVREADRVLQLSITESGAEVTCDWMPTVRVDATQMAQVFQNLLSNAI
ncbi:MAG: CHASE3 domain-containing protein, partial [Gemmatimonadota bacterium]